MRLIRTEPADSLAPLAHTSRRPRDLVLSLGVLLAVVALMIGTYRLLHHGDEPVVVDVAPAIAQARTAGDFPVAVPAGLPDGWRTVSARYQPGDGQAILRIGYLSPAGAGFQVIESDRPADALLAAELTTGARPLGEERLGRLSWQHYLGRPGERALVLLEPDRTLLVIGAGSPAELIELASALPA